MVIIECVDCIYFSTCMSNNAFELDCVIKRMYNELEETKKLRGGDI